MALSRAHRREEMNFWPGIVDPLSTMLIGIVFLLSVFVLGQFFLSQELTGKDSALDRLNRQLSELTDLLALERSSKKAIRIGAWAASGALNSIRIAKGKAAETKTRKKATYRGRHILLKRPSNLTAKQAFALDGMLANDADLREAYEAKERFFQIWDAPDRGSAEMAIDEWMETVPPQHRGYSDWSVG